MRENAQVVLAMKQARKMGRNVALATIVRVTGSAYRREGAKMLIDELGQMTGMISGGCLEPDVAEVAKQVLAQGSPLVKRYAMDEDLVWGLGLGCPGTVDVFIEPVEQSRIREDHDPSPFHAWVSCLEEERAGVLCTVLEEAPELSLKTGDRLFVSVDGVITGNLGEHQWTMDVVAYARQKLDEQFPKSETRAYDRPNGQKIHIFFDVNVPTAELMIFGAGHDAIPLATMSVALGIKTIVVDPRPAYNSSERFPGADCLLISPSAYKDQINIRSRTYVIIMNHHLERDKSALQFALQSKAPYIGLLGPRSRRDRILEALKTEGAVFSNDQMARLYNPVGLDIGADSSEEIAVSIIAEILAVRNGHAGGSLRERTSIHQSPAKDEATVSKAVQSNSTCGLEAFVAKKKGDTA